MDPERGGGVVGEEDERERENERKKEKLKKQVWDPLRRLNLTTLTKTVNLSAKS